MIANKILLVLLLISGSFCNIWYGI